jgi:hypothetical protein
MPPCNTLTPAHKAAGARRHKLKQEYTMDNPRNRIMKIGSSQFSYFCGTDIHLLLMQTCFITRHTTYIEFAFKIILITPQQAQYLKCSSAS